MIARPRHSKALLALLLLMLSTNVDAAVFDVPSDLDLIRDADAIVIGRAVDHHGEFALNGDIVTRTTLEVEAVLKGRIDSNKLLVIRDLGGEVGAQVMGVSGGVTYRRHERALIFLERDSEGYWTTYGMSLGKFTAAADEQGRRVFMRTLESDSIAAANGDAAHEAARLERPFVVFIQQQLAERPQQRQRIREEDYLAPAPSRRVIAEPTPAGLRTTEENHYPASAYTQGNFRWQAFDLGRSVTFFSSGTQPGYDATGAAQRALAAWTNEATSNIAYFYGGTTSRGFVQDGFNTIVFNSSTDVPSGAVGYAKWWASGTHTYNGETFYSIEEGDVVIRSNLTMSQKAFEEVVTHELGHTLGFRHSDAATPASTAAVMRTTVSGNYGSTLGPWDVEAATHVYIPPATSCTPPSITGQPQSTSVTSGTTVTLTVSATGTAPLSYQWYIGTSGDLSAPISGATGTSLTVAPTTTTSYWVRVSNACGSANSATSTVTVVAPAPAARMAGDFDGNGSADVVWRNRSTGAVRIWLLQGVSVISSVALPTVADLTWQLAGAGDLNSDGMHDLVWRNIRTGENAVWYMNNATVASTGSLTTVTDVNWRIESVVDFNRDGHYDLVWRHHGNGSNAIWYMSGSTLASSASLKAVPDLSWDLAGTGDTNSDHHVDIVWRNRVTGQNVIWLMTGTTLTSSTTLALVADQSWQIGGVASFNRDGVADILWRNYSSGQNAAWIVGGAQVGYVDYLPYEYDMNWEIVGPR